jgi:hypothetical protein
VALEGDPCESIVRETNQSVTCVMMVWFVLEILVIKQFRVYLFPFKDFILLGCPEIRRIITIYIHIF